MDKADKILAVIGLVAGALANVTVLLQAAEEGGLIRAYFAVSLAATIVGTLGLRQLGDKPRAAGQLFLAAALVGWFTAWPWYMLAAICFVAAAVLAFRTPTRTATRVRAASPESTSVFEPVLLPNGNLRIPVGAMINGVMVDGTAEVAPGTAEYDLWLPRVRKRK